MDLGKLFPGIGPHATNLKDIYAPYNPSVIPNLDLMSYRGDPNTGGFVRKDSPNTIFLNERADTRNTFPQVLPHEMEHVLQNRVDSRRPDNTGYDINVIREYRKQKGGPDLDAEVGITRALRMSAANPEIPKYFKEKYGYPIAYYGQLRPGEYSLREQWAELSAAEQYLRKDLTKDPFIRKHIFNDDNGLIRTYKGTTGLRTDRWDARDPAPMVAEPTDSKLPKFLQQLFGM